MIVEVNTDWIHVVMDDHLLKGSYQFLPDGRAEEWHKTPSLFHGWVNEQ